MKRLHWLAPAVALAIAAGCAPSRNATFSEVGDTVELRTGRSLDLPASVEADDVETRTRALLEQPMDIDSAVEIGLLNSRRLRTALEEVGVARAELIGGGLPENPKISAGFFKERDVDSGTYERYGVSQDITSLLFWPIRKRGLDDRLDAAQLRASHETLAIIAEIKRSFYSLQAAQSRRDLFQSVLSSAESGSELARRQFEAGNINRLTLAFQKTLASEAALELVHKQTELELARAELVDLLGISGVTAEWTVDPNLPALPDSSALPANLEELALQQRLDLASDRRQAEGWESSKSAAKTLYVPPIELGLEREEDFEGTLQGPTIEAQIPLFDRGQEERANADVQARLAHEAAATSEGRIRTEVRSAAARVRDTRRTASLIQDSILPLRREIVEETQLHYNFMLQGVYQLLDAKREELHAQEDAILTRRDFWLAWTDLELAVGGTLEGEKR